MQVELDRGDDAEVAAPAGSMSKPRTTWRDIAGDLRAAIARGDYAPGARLPSRSKLMQRYEVAPQTVVNAINALRAEGLVVGLPGSGWYVRSTQPLIALRVTGSAGPSALQGEAPSPPTPTPVAGLPASTWRCESSPLSTR